MPIQNTTLPCPQCGDPDALSLVTPTIGTCAGEVTQTPQRITSFQPGGYTEHTLPHPDSALYCGSCEWNSPEVDEGLLLEKLRQHQHRQALALVAAQSTTPSTSTPDLSRNVRLMLDANTGHLPTVERGYLDLQAHRRDHDPAAARLLVDARPCGWLVTCPPPDELLGAGSAVRWRNPNLWSLLDLAGRIGAGWLLLDSDATAIPGLPLFDQ